MGINSILKFSPLFLFSLDLIIRFFESIFKTIKNHKNKEENEISDIDIMIVSAATYVLSGLYIPPGYELFKTAYSATLFFTAINILVEIAEIALSKKISLALKLQYIAVLICILVSYTIIFISL